MGKKQDLRIDRREDHRHGSNLPEDVGAAATAADARADARDLARAAVVASDATAVHEVGVQRIRHGVAVLGHAHRVPFSDGDLAVVTAARDTPRAALLLAAANAVREIVVGVDVIELRGRLVVPGAPSVAAVERHHGTLIGCEHHDLRVVRIDPAVLVVIAAGGAPEGGERAAAVDRLPGHGAGDDHLVSVLGVEQRHGDVAATDAARGAGVLGDADPALAGIVGAKDAHAVRCNDGKKTLRITRRDGHVGLLNAAFLGRR